jgi:hypothetical protein
VIQEPNKGTQEARPEEDTTQEVAPTGQFAFRLRPELEFKLGRNDSSDEDRFTTLVTPTTPTIGATLLNVRPCVNAETLEKFDEKALHSDHRSWWERFLNIASQG